MTTVDICDHFLFQKYNVKNRLKYMMKMTGKNFHTLESGNNNTCCNSCYCSRTQKCVACSCVWIPLLTIVGLVIALLVGAALVTEQFERHVFKLSGEIDLFIEVRSASLFIKEGKVFAFGSVASVWSACVGVVGRRSCHAVLETTTSTTTATTNTAWPI